MNTVVNEIDDFFSGLARLAYDHKANVQRQIEGFFHDLAFRYEIFQIQKREIDRHLASNFNVFDYIVPNRDENRLSDIIANLLDPRGSHGQRDIFLRQFLFEVRNAANLPEDLADNASPLASQPSDMSLAECRVIREAATKNIVRLQRDRSSRTPSA